MGNAGQDAVQLEVLEGQLTWLVHIIGAVIRGRLSSSTAESQETIDGDLAARAFGLLQIVDSGYAAEPSAPHMFGIHIAACLWYMHCRRNSSGAVKSWCIHVGGSADHLQDALTASYWSLPLQVVLAPLLEWFVSSQILLSLKLPP